MSDKLNPEFIRRMYPVKSIAQYKNGLIAVERKSVVNDENIYLVARGDRGKITHLSPRARSHLAFICAATSIEFRSIMTLTYGKFYPLDGAAVKGHLNLMLIWLRAAYPGFSYVWVLEFQQRGAPHVHILTSLSEPLEWQRREFAHKWSGYSSKFNTNLEDERTEADTVSERRKVYQVHRHPKSWEAIRRPDGAVRYMLKYCLKMSQKQVPTSYQDVGRFYGYSRDVKDNISVEARLRLDDEGLDLILETMGHKTAKWDIPPKYIFGLELNLEDEG